MSKELALLREDYTNTKKIVEKNNKIIEELLKNQDVKKFFDIYINNEEKRKN